MNDVKLGTSRTRDYAPPLPGREYTMPCICMFMFGPNLSPRAYVKHRGVVSAFATAIPDAAGSLRVCVHALTVVALLGTSVTFSGALSNCYHAPKILLRGAPLFFGCV